jgi:predicted chitinase/spore germination protein YaaH
MFHEPVAKTTQSILAMTLDEKPKQKIEKTFTFVPGSAPNKFDNIDLQNLTVLSFYDLPFDTDGTFIQDAYGYGSFYSPNANTLFQDARARGIKVLATLTQTYNPDINEFLDNPHSQQKLFEESLTAVRDMNIDGVTINIEYDGDSDPYYKEKFNTFVNNFTQYMHTNQPGSLVSVAIPSNIGNNSIYDLGFISNASDNTMIVAYNFPVPEREFTNIISPIFGANSTEYQKNLQSTTENFLTHVSADKLIMERAWYGNGHTYHLYATDTSNDTPTIFTANTLNEPLSPYTVERLISDVPYEAREAARKNLPHIIEALKHENILNANVLAYALATIQHETANTFEPIDEFKGRKSARRLGYEGGTDYFGRGFIQLTHLRNYKKIGQRIGVGDLLVEQPQKASSPKIAAKVLAAYFKDFGIAELATNGNFVDARTLINPDFHGYSIAEIAYVYLSALI